MGGAQCEGSPTEPLNITACQAVCLANEKCVAMDWNKKDNPYMNCRCWLHMAQPGALKEDADNDQWVKDTVTPCPSAVEVTAVPAGCVSDVTKHCDGSGGTEKKLGMVDSFDDCVSLVLASEPTADGVTWGEGDTRRGECYAEFGQTGCRDVDVWTNCKIAPACAGDITQACDGSGGTEDKIGMADSFGECVALVKKTKVTANGVTWGEGDKRRGECYAEYGQTGCKNVDVWTNCVINPQCAGAVTQACDGSGGSENKIGMTDSFAECVALVKTTNPTANGVTWGEGESRRGECYAEFGQTGCKT